MTISKIFKTIICSVLSVVYIFIICSATVIGAEKTIKKGVIYKKGTVEDENGISDVNILEVSPSASKVKIVPTLPDGYVIGAQLLSDQAELASRDGMTAIAGINCDMFVMEEDMQVSLGTPINATIIDGVLYNSAHNAGEAKNLPVFGIDDEGAPFLGHIYITCDIKITDDNGNVNSEKSTLLNHNYGTFTSLAMFTRKLNPEHRLQILNYEDNDVYGIKKSSCNLYVISGIDDADNIRAGVAYKGRIENVLRGELETDIPEGCVVIADTLRAISYADKGMEIEFTFSVNEIDEDINIIGSRNNLVQCVGAYNWIVKGGIVQTEDIFKKQSFPPIDYIVNTKTAKTGIGIKEDGTIIAATVDATSVSAGMTMEEWGSFFASQGAVNAVNFDGGGSTEMVVISSGKRAETVNAPTGGGSREIASGLLLLSEGGGFKGYDEPQKDMFTITLISVFGAMTVILIANTAKNFLKKRKGK